MNSAAKNNYYEQAEHALAELDGVKADELFLSLVLALEDEFGKNQKDVAAELQRIAKQIEGEGKIDESLRFKQRTCEVLLRRSMAERRRNSPPPGSNAAKEGKALTQMIFVCFTADPASYSSFLQRTELNLELRVLPDGSRWVRGKNSQIMLIARVQNPKLPGFFPLFVAASRVDAAKHLQDGGNFLDGEELDVCGLKMLVMKDKAGQRFFLAGSEILQNI